MQLFDDLDFAFVPEGEMTSAEGASANASVSSVSTSDESSSGEQKSKKKRERTMLEVLPGQVALPKAVELEVSSLEEYEDYMRRVSASRVLTEGQKSDLQNQRKRIRNRIYSQQKRQKEKETKRSESALVQDLRAQITRLSHENAMLREENKRLGGTVHLKLTRPLSLFAIVISVSFLVSPVSPFWSSKSQSFDTGRTLMSVSPAPSSSSFFWGGGWFSAKCETNPFSGCSRLIRNDTATVWKCALA